MKARSLCALFISAGVKSSAHVLMIWGKRRPGLGLLFCVCCAVLYVLFSVCCAVLCVLCCSSKVCPVNCAYCAILGCAVPCVFVCAVLSAPAVLWYAGLCLLFIQSAGLETDVRKFSESLWLRPNIYRSQNINEGTQMEGVWAICNFCSEEVD